MKKKGTTIILLLLFGGFGVHRFYLGDHGMGFIFLASLLLFWPVASVLVIIDLVRFAVMDRADFDLEYNKKE